MEFPAVVDDVNGIAEPVKRFGRAAPVPAGDVDALTEAARELLSDSAALAEAREGARRARETLTWQSLLPAAHLDLYRELTVIFLSWRFARELIDRQLESLVPAGQRRAPRPRRGRGGGLPVSRPRGGRGALRRPPGGARRGNGSTRRGARDVLGDARRRRGGGVRGRVRPRGAAPVPAVRARARGRSPRKRIRRAWRNGPRCRGALGGARQGRRERSYPAGYGRD